MFKKIFQKKWFTLIFTAVLISVLSLTGFLAYKYYNQGVLVLSHLKHNTQILNQNQSEIEVFLEKNFQIFQTFEEHLKESDFELANKTILKLEKDSTKIKTIKQRIPNLKEMLKHDLDIQDSKEIYTSAKEVLDHRSQFLENLYLVQQTQICNIKNITGASEAIHIINQQNLETENQPNLNLAQLKKVVTNFELAADNIKQIENCFNQINKQYKTEEFLAVLKSDIEFFEKQADLFEQARIGIVDSNQRKLDDIKKELDNIEQREVKIFNSQDYHSAFQNIFQEVILESDKQANQTLQNYENLINRINSKYWFVFN